MGVEIKKNDKEDSKGEAGGAELKKGGRGGSERLMMGEGVMYSFVMHSPYCVWDVGTLLDKVIKNRKGE
jgi:hypothetical protein